jgi:hypothetical protein
MTWAIWALVLIAQAGSSTWASRARNTGSVAYHGVAAIFSHGVWFVSNFFLVDNVIKVAREGTPADALFLGAFYTTFCVIGSMSAHAITARYFEIGKRRVGA